jgi:hypothetical protein
MGNPNNNPVKPLGPLKIQSNIFEKKYKLEAKNYLPKSEYKQQEPKVDNSLFNILKKPDSSQPSFSSYFQFKFADNNGEKIDPNSFKDYSYCKVELFKENESKKLYEGLQDLEDENDNVIQDSDIDAIKRENFVGPQRRINTDNRQSVRDRNFKPY